MAGTLQRIGRDIPACSVAGIAWRRLHDFLKRRLVGAVDGASVYVSCLQRHTIRFAANFSHCRNAPETRTRCAKRGYTKGSQSPRRARRVAWNIFVVCFILCEHHTFLSVLRGVATSVGVRMFAAGQAYRASLAWLMAFWRWSRRPAGRRLGLVLKAWRVRFVPGMVPASHCALGAGFASGSAVALERMQCELVGRLPRDVRSALRCAAAVAAAPP